MQTHERNAPLQPAPACTGAGRRHPLPPNAPALGCAILQGHGPCGCSWPACAPQRALGACFSVARPAAPRSPPAARLRRGGAGAPDGSLCGAAGAASDPRSPASTALGRGYERCASRRRLRLRCALPAGSASTATTRAVPSSSGAGGRVWRAACSSDPAPRLCVTCLRPMLCMLCRSLLVRSLSLLGDFHCANWCVSHTPVTVGFGCLLGSPAQVRESGIRSEAQARTLWGCIYRIGGGQRRGACWRG